MKKISTLLLVAFIASTSLFSQETEDEYPAAVSINLGMSLVGNLINSVDNADVFSLPAFQGVFDYKFENFGIGAGVSYQAMGYNYDDFKTTVNRLNFGIRALGYFGSSKKADLYAGVRIGATNWSISSTSNDPNYDPEDDVGFGSRTLPAFQLILFGFRGYITDNIGLNAEVAVGAPHYVSGGVTYRF